MARKRKNPGIAPEIFYDLDFCPIRSTYSKLSGKWVVLILTHRWLCVPKSNGFGAAARRLQHNGFRQGLSRRTWEYTALESEKSKKNWN